MEELLTDRFKRVRQQTKQRVERLNAEELNIQAIPEASPPKWHLAHTTWFFENFILKEFLKGYSVFNSEYGFLFNSYYETSGTFIPKSRRFTLTRPYIDEIMNYRSTVENEVLKLMGESLNPEITRRVRLGIAHEEQHQELLFMDIKANFSANPLGPAYVEEEVAAPSIPPQTEWKKIQGGIVKVGAEPHDFAFDNERPRHSTFLEDYEIAAHPVSNGAYREFISAGGYEDPKYWLSDGWAFVKSHSLKHPLYWAQSEGDWRFSLAGWQPLKPNEAVTHLSFFEADAFARWSGARLPTESEWEHASGELSGRGTVWEWTGSPYVGYPGYSPLDGALGEYNGKFMNNQFVLRGGCLFTPRDHATKTYRNYFPPESRWQFSGLRLAKIRKDRS
jgi:ergothioneine biosynthesis protein EgtB